MPYDRSGARAGQDVVLSIQFSQNGVPVDIYDIESVKIYNPSSTLITTIDGSSIVNVDGVNGLYKVTYEVPSTGDQGLWSDVWTNIKFTAQAEYVSSTQYFYVVPESQAVPGSNTVVIYTYVKDANGNAKVGIHGFAEIIDPPYYTGGSYFANPMDRGIRATSDSNGLLEWSVPQGARIRFWIDATDLKLEKTAPSTATTTELYDLEGI